jgi:RHS repeat-associated protein
VSDDPYGYNSPYGSGGPTTNRVLWPLGDHLQSTRDTVDSQGQRREQKVYDTFGNVIEEVDYDSWGLELAAGDPSGVDILFGYTGREWDKDIGLQYNRARWYDPKSGRWINQDPISFAAGDANLYRYVGNHSSMASDPSGLAEFPTPTTQWHHLLPREFELLFKNLGINIHDAEWGWIIDVEYHKELHKTWNSEFQKLIDDCGKRGTYVTKDDVLKLHKELMSKYSHILRNGVQANKSYWQWLSWRSRIVAAGQEALQSGVGKTLTFASKVGKVTTVVTVVITLTNDGVLAAAESGVKDAIFPLDLIAAEACKELKPIAEEFHRGNNLRVKTKAQILIEIQNGGPIPLTPQGGQNGRGRTDSPQNAR